MKGATLGYFTWSTFEYPYTTLIEGFVFEPLFIFSGFAMLKWNVDPVILTVIVAILGILIY